MENAQVLEMVEFKIKKEVSTIEAEKALASLDHFVQSQKGFVHRSTVKDETGSYYDLVYWINKEDALAAAENAMKSPQCAPAFAVIDEESVRMRHLPILN